MTMYQMWFGVRNNDRAKRPNAFSR